MFINQELDICPSYGWQGGPSFNTRIVTTQSWRERRNANNMECRHNYSLPLQNIFNSGYLETLKQAYLACMGRTHSFKVKDYSDFKAENEVFGEGDGVSTVFQLSKTSTFGSVSYVRTIEKPEPGVIIKVGASIASPSIDLLTGKVTFSSAPASGVILRWTGEFRVPVRFASDTLNTTIDNKTPDGAEYFINGSVDLIEVFGE
jgi:uncharacterized protein (TIGR02217 family)